MSARPKLEPLGALEEAVMEAIWRAGPSTAREVHDRFHRKQERAYTTIMTTMDRLHRKGLLRREKDGLAWRYTPVFTREAFARALADSLVGSILAAHGEQALTAFVDATARADRSMLDRLAELIADARKRHP